MIIGSLAFIMNEEVSDGKMMQLGQMWMNHHDRNTSDTALSHRFGKRATDLKKQANKISGYLVQRAERQGKPVDEYEVEDKVGQALANKNGIRHNIGTPQVSQGNVYDRQDVINSLHQQSGERSMRAIGRLTDWYNKKGLYQQPTTQTQTPVQPSVQNPNRVN